MRYASNNFTRQPGYKIMGSLHARASSSLTYTPWHTWVEEHSRDYEFLRTCVPSAPTEHVWPQRKGRTLPIETRSYSTSTRHACGLPCARFLYSSGNEVIVKERGGPTVCARTHGTPRFAKLAAGDGVTWQSCFVYLGVCLLSTHAWEYGFRLLLLLASSNGHECARSSTDTSIANTTLYCDSHVRWSWKQGDVGSLVGCKSKAYTDRRCC